MTKSSKKHQAIVGGTAGRPLRPQEMRAVFSEVPPARSRIMKSIRQKHTKPEVIVRRTIHSMGFRFRLHQHSLPGRPDIVMRRFGLIVQVHGCFWHQHGCSISNIPRTRTEYWLPKLARNVKRDKENASLLKSMGWRVVTIWECEVGDSDTLSRKLRKVLMGGRSVDRR
jgi:DNA mismatch endonuclease (patch repair protein)